MWWQWSGRWAGVCVRRMKTPLYCQLGDKCCCWRGFLACLARRSILHPRESNESFIGDSLKFITVMLVSGGWSARQSA